MSGIVPAPIARQPWQMLFPLFTLIGFGALVLFSAAAGSWDPYASSHLLRFGVFLVMAFVLFVPWASIVVAIVLPVFPIATAMPLVPPLGLVMLLAWRLVRPGLLPVWAGVPLGLLDDLYSGQPFGFAVFTWSLVMLGIEILETRMPWRSYWQDWFTAAMVIVSYLLAGWLLSGGQPTVHSLVALFPQFVLTVLIFPIAARLVAMLDRVRLTRWKVL